MDEMKLLENIKEKELSILDYLPGNVIATDLNFVLTPFSTVWSVGEKRF